MTENLEEKILKKLKESGYPLEIETTEILEHKGWRVANQVGYLDSDEKKWRHIDIRADYAEDLSQSPIYKRLAIHLYVECKKIKTPWVFYMRNKEEMPFFPFDLLNLLKEGSWPPVHPKSFLEKELRKNCFHYLAEENIGVISFEPFNNVSKVNVSKVNVSKVFEATHQVIKSLKYNLERIKSLWRESLHPSNSVKFSTFFIAYPLIVVEGKLYGLYGKDGPITPLNYLQYLVNYNDEDFLVDIVTIEFLNEYLEIINREFNFLKENVNLLQPNLSNYK